MDVGDHAVAGDGSWHLIGAEAAVQGQRPTLTASASVPRSGGGSLPALRPDPPLRRRRRLLGEQAVAVDDGGGKVDDLAVGGA